MRELSIARDRIKSDKLNHKLSVLQRKPKSKVLEISKKYKCRKLGNYLKSVRWHRKQKDKISKGREITREICLSREPHRRLIR